MADFVPSQKYASDFNKAKKYENGDAVQAETVNNLIEGQLFVQGIATNQPKVVEDNTEGSPTVYFENKDGLQRFVFRNIKGKGGKPGAKGDNGNIMRFVDGSLSIASSVDTTTTVGISHILNPENISVGDLVLDPYYKENPPSGDGYLCIWQITSLNTKDVADLKGLGYVIAPKGIDGKTPYIVGADWYIDGVYQGRAEGFSPTIEVEKKGEEYYIYITDVNTVGTPDPIKIKEGRDGVGVKSIDQTTENTGSGELNVIKVYDDNNKEIGSFNIRNGGRGEKGDTITGVVQSVTSNTDGGVNQIKVTISNGDVYTFEVKNGSKGSKGDNGNIMRFADSSLGTLSEIDTTLNISRDNLLNSTDVAQGDVVLDTHYTQGEEYYICIWEVTQVSSTAQGVVISLRGMGYVTSSKGGTVKIEVDNALSSTSENPVQNKVVTTALNTKVPTTTTVNGHPLSSNVTVTKSDVGLGNVDNVKQYSASNPPPYPVTSVAGKTGAVTLAYTDLSGTPNISQMITDQIDGLADVARSGSYTDLTDKPTINNTTYTLTKSGTTITLTGSDGKTSSVTDADTNTTYEEATTSSAGLMSAKDKLKLNGITAGATANVGTITGVSLNGTSVATSGVANITVSKSTVGLGNVANTGDSATPVANGTTKFTTGGAYTELAKKVDKSTTVNGYALSGNVTVTASDLGLGNVENKSSNTIRSEITKSNVTTALGYTPPTLSQVQSDTDSRIEGYANNNIVGVYAEKKNGVYYVEGTGTTAGVWLGTNNEISSYYNGLTIAYKVGIAGAENLTLNINGLGAKSVVRNASSAVTTHYGVGSVVLLVYTTDDGTSYWKVADYDSDTKTRSSNKTGTKMYVIGAQTQSTSGQTTYSNSKVYIGTDNCLYSNGSKVGLASDITTNANNISSLTTTVNGKADITTVNAIAGTANTNAQAIENIAPRLQDVETDIATFKGNSSVTGSIDQKISSAINDFANSATANGTIDTFKELVDYVAEHGSEVEAITGDITNLKGRMSTAETNISKKANQTALDDTNSTVSSLSTSVTNLNNNKADKSSLSAYALQSTVENLSGEVSSHSTRLDEFEQRAYSIETDITNNVKPSITGVTNRVASVEDRATALENGKVDKVTGKGLSTNDYTTDDKKKLSGIASGAEVNQDAFSNVKVGTTTISADSKTDTIELANGSNITITADDTNDKVTIAVSSDFANRVSTLENDITKINTFEEKLDAKADKATDLIDDSVGYVKSVPLNVAPYAEILSIDSAVTSVKSVGRNLFNIVGKDFSNEISLGSMHGQKINATYKENTQYTFSWVSTCTWANSSSTYLYMRVYYTDGTNSGYSYYVARKGDNKRRYTWTTASGKTVNYIQFTYSDEGTFLFEDAQLVEGTSIMSPYAPKFEEILTPTDIANGNNVIKVEGGGTLTFVNANSINVESSVKYYINANQEISANKFVGDLLGASKISGSAMYATPSTDDNSIDMRITKAQSLVDYAVDTALDAYNKATKGIKKAYTQYTSGAGSAGTFHLYLQLQDNTTIEVENFSSDMEGFIMDVFRQNQ